MQAHRIKVTVPSDHRVTLTLPAHFPSGPAEIIVLTDSPQEKKIIKLAGALASDMPLATRDDPVAEALQELRRERTRRLEEIEMDIVPTESD